MPGMLSLKKNTINHTSSEMATKLTDLPDELLDQICECLHQMTGGFTRDLIPLSTVSIRFNGLLRPLLFKTIRMHLTHRYVDKRTFNMLINCCMYPDFAKLIKNFIQDDGYKFREHGSEDLRLTNELTRLIARQAISNMTGLTTVTTDCMNSPIVYFVRTLCIRRPLHFKVSSCKCYEREGFQKTEIGRLGRSDIDHLFSIITRKINMLHDLPLWLTERPTRIQALFLADVKPSFNVHNQPVTIFNSFNLLTQLEELHLNNENGTLGWAFDILGDALISLPQLQRLSVKGSRICNIVLSVVQKLDQLESLRLNSDSTTVFHAHLRNHTFEGLPYQKISRLKRLEIRYISRYLSVEHIVPQSLTHLRIEYQNRSERLSAFNLQWIAKQCPNMESLELDIGALANLWHPTAVAGVDIDMDVYRMLDALSNFKSLKRLRLFPSYWESRGGYLYFSQPVEDMQTVKIFDHIRRICTSLEMLIISNSTLDYMARTEVSARGLSEPVKWTVRANGFGGKRMLLITEEAKRQYHLEQIWEGARRLTMITVRHNTSRPHFDDLQDWTIAPFEFRFDEPLSCN